MFQLPALLFKMDKKLIEESKNCTKCTEWLHHCKAECCKLFRISKICCVSNLQCDFSIKYVMFNILLSADMQWYVRLRDCIYSRGFLKVPSKYCIAKGNWIFVYKNCNQLRNNLCLGHPNSKPKICRDLTLENVNTIENAIITPNCLFKYQSEGIKYENNKRK